MGVYVKTPAQKMKAELSFYHWILNLLYYINLKSCIFFSF